MACHEVSLADEICGLDRLLAEAEVGHRDTAGLLGVIIKVSLRVHVSVVADDLDGVLVRTDSTVSTKSPELAVHCAFRCRDELRTGLQGQVRDIIFDTEREALLINIFKDSLDLCRIRILGAETIASGIDFDVLELGIKECGDNVEVKRLAGSARFLCPVEDVDDLCGLRDRCKKCIVAERTIQSDFDDTDLGPFLLAHIIDGLIDRLADGAHSDDDGFRFRIAIIVEEAVVRTDLLVDLVHVLLNDCRHLIICRVACFTSLEEDIRVLSGASLARMIRIQSMIAEFLDRFMIDHLVQISIIPCADLLDLV